VQRALVFTLLFVLGCAVGGAASQLVVPPARAGTTPIRWEYLCTNGATAEQMNQVGAAGWELVTAVPLNPGGGWRDADLGFCFKRALP